MAWRMKRKLYWKLKGDPAEANCAKIIKEIETLKNSNIHLTCMTCGENRKVCLLNLSIRCLCLSLYCFIHSRFIHTVRSLELWHYVTDLLDCFTEPPTIMSLNSHLFHLISFEIKADKCHHSHNAQFYI